MKHFRFSLILAFFVLATGLNAQKKYNTGLTFDDNKYNKAMTKATLTRSLYTNMPSQASLKQYAPEIQNQGSFGTCVGWSSAYCALTIVKSQQNHWNGKYAITNNAFSPWFTYTVIKSYDDYNCEFGTSIDDALNSFKNTGAVKLSDLNSSCPGDVSYLYSSASQVKINDYAKIFGLSDLGNYKVEAAKKSLSEGKPVVIGLKCPDSFSYATGCWNPTEDYTQSYGGHALCVVGYDDNQYGGAFEIQNSWGTEWGNQGYIWIKYVDFGNWVKYGYELIDGIGNNPNTNQINLSGSLRFVLSTGEEMQTRLENNVYKMSRPYSSGTKFRIYLSNNEPAFVYAFGSDMTNKTYQLFPYRPDISPALNYSQNNVALPDEDHYIEMDNTLGTDFLCVLYSSKELNIDEIRTKVENGYGSFLNKVNTAVGYDLIPSESAGLTSGQIGFKAVSADKNIVAIIVETKHVK
jgi:hypothetical protein